MGLESGWGHRSMLEWGRVQSGEGKGSSGQRLRWGCGLELRSETGQLGCGVRIGDGFQGEDVGYSRQRWDDSWVGGKVRNRVIRLE